MHDLPPECRAALDGLRGELPSGALVRATDRLSQRYRTGDVPASPHLHDDAAAAAYAAYRMPATFAAVSAALAQVRGVVAPRTLLDLGGGTGSALWAAALTWPSLAAAVVVEGALPVLELGRRLAAASTTGTVRDAEWRSDDVSSAEIDADVVTVSYVLGELAERPRVDLIRRLAASRAVVVVVEPGTPAGYRRVLAARDVLIGSGRSVLAPCPHDLRCPMSESDWCHMAVRLERSRVHRVAKGVDLGHEDEKFSYVVAGSAPAGRPAGRVVRHPLIRKGLVELQVCAERPALTTVPVPKSRGAEYRAARDVRWGDPWPLSSA